MNYRKFIALLLTLALLLINMSCDQDSTTEPPKTIDQLITEGWINFEKQQYQNAINSFEAALNIDINFDEAYLGLGWSFAKIDSVVKGNTNAKIAIHLNPELVDAYTCYAFTSFQLNQYNQSIAAAKKVIETEGEYYIFTHDPEITITKLRILLAQCYFETGQYSLAHQQVNILKPDNTLNPSSSNYISDLCEIIESLND